MRHFDMFFSKFQNIITEGDVYSHLSYIFEDINLTFDDLFIIINLAVKGIISQENIVVEKMNGIPIGITFREGKVRFSFNKSHVKKNSQNSLTYFDIKDKYSHSSKDKDKVIFSLCEIINSIFSSTNHEILSDIFKEGKNILTVDIITTENTIIIPYSKNIVVFSSFREYNEQGNVIYEINGHISKKIYDLIQDINYKTLEKYNIKFSNNVYLNVLPNSEDIKKQYESELFSYMKRYNLSKRDKISTYHFLFYVELLRKKKKEYNSTITEEEIEKIAKRWIGMNNDYTFSKLKNDIKEDGENFLQWIENYEKKEKDTDFKANITPIENLFSRLGVLILKNATGLLNLNSSEESDKLKKNLEYAIRELEKTKSPDIIEDVVNSLKKIDSIGGLDAILPTEGIVFVYKSKYYKFDGAFKALKELIELFDKNQKK